MTELEKVLAAVLGDDDAAKAASEVAVRHLAYRIRAELVCCDIYERVQRDGGDENAIGRTVMHGEPHSLCYWGEAAARLVEEEENS